MGDPMTEAAGSSPGPSALGGEPWPRSQAAAHLRPPPRPRRTRKGLRLPVAWCSALAMSRVPSTAQPQHCSRFKSNNEEVSGRVKKGKGPERQSTPGDECGTPVRTGHCARCVPCVISFSYHNDLSKEHYHRFTGEETEAVSYNWTCPGSQISAPQTLTCVRIPGIWVACRVWLGRFCIFNKLSGACCCCWREPLREHPGPRE